MTTSATSTGRGVVALLAAVLLVARPGAAADRLPSFADVLARAEPAVVNVSTVARPANEEGQPETMQDLLRRFFGQPPSGGRSLGSGFIISADGDIVTNNHVVAGAEKIRVRMATEEEFDAKLVGSDDKTDIALLRIKAPRPLPTLPLGDSEALRVGDWVLAIGNPFGLTQTATAGIVSAKGRFLGAGPYDDFIQTDASINPGNSGGPLVDQDGRVVGINAAIVSPAGGNVGIGFAVPIALARWVVDQIREHGSVVRGWVGVAVQAVTPELARSFGLHGAEGALVADVVSGGPAAKAGLARGDVIVRWGDRPVQRSRDLPFMVALTPPGTRVPVTILRDGKERSIDVTVERMPAEGKRESRAAPRGGDLEGWGLAVESLAPDDARRLGLKPGTGVVVTDVSDGSPAEDAGLEAGDVIVEANRRPVRSPAELGRALAASPRRALLLVRRNGASLYIEMER
ncbi:MAG: DegQ family serine endoprotease [Deltaproteobacteria bacterium]|nr:MAG: DegQ family serine endoprotease [Deltaproteobacteria bacterium]